MDSGTGTEKTFTLNLASMEEYSVRYLIITVSEEGKKSRIYRLEVDVYPAEIFAGWYEK